MALTPYSLPVTTGGDGKKRARKDQHETAINAAIASAVADGTAGKLDGTNAALSDLMGDAVTKAVPADADAFGGLDSADGGEFKLFSWSGIKSALKAYFDTLYLAASPLLSSIAAVASDGKVLIKTGVNTISGFSVSSYVRDTIWPMASGSDIRTAINAQPLSSLLSTITALSENGVALVKTGASTIAGFPVSAYIRDTIWPMANGADIRTAINAQPASSILSSVAALVANGVALVKTGPTEVTGFATTPYMRETIWSLASKVAVKVELNLDNVANLAPADYPVSTAQLTALNGKIDGLFAQRYVNGGMVYLTGISFDNGRVLPIHDEWGRMVQVDPATAKLWRVPLPSEIDLQITANMPVSAALIDGFRVSMGFETDSGQAIAMADDSGSLLVLRKLDNTHHRVEDLLNESSDLLSAPSICWLSNSLAHGAYNLPNKFWLQIVNALTDWQVYNFSTQGEEPTDSFWDLVAGTRDNNTGFGLRDLNPAYISGPDTSNANWRHRWLDDYVSAVNQLVLGARAVGAMALIQTEPRNHSPEVTAALAQIAAKRDMPFVDVGSERRIANGDFGGVATTDYNQGGFSSGVDFTHPGTRTQWIIANAMRRAIDALPRPASSVKIFRARNPAASLSDLAFDDNVGRYERFDVLAMGGRALAPASYKDFDNLQAAVTVAVVNDEHLALAANQAITFTAPALISAVVNGTASTLDVVRIDTNVKTAGVAAYVRSPLQQLDYNPKGGSWTAVEVAAFPADLTGSVYNNGFEDLTYQGEVTHPVDGTKILTFTPETPNRGALTYTRVSGPGPASFSGTSQWAGRPAEFYEALGSPASGWRAVTMIDGVITLAGETALENAMVDDRIDVLLVPTGSMVMSRSPVVSWPRPNLPKLVSSKPLIKLPSAAPIYDLKADNVGWLTVDASGTVGGPPSTAAPADGWAASGITVVAQISNGVRIRTTVDLQPHATELTWAIIEVWARYAPAKHSPADDFATSSITLTSVDFRRLAVRIGKAGADRGSQVLTDIGTPAPDPRIRFRVPVPPQSLYGPSAGDYLRNLDIYSPNGTLNFERVRIYKET